VALANRTQPAFALLENSTAVAKYNALTGRGTRFDICGLPGIFRLSPRHGTPRYAWGRRMVSGTVAFPSARMPYRNISSFRSLVAMPRYYFHVHGHRSSVDEDGAELSDSSAAWCEATLIASEMMRDGCAELRPGQGWELEVTDEFRNSLYFISVRGRRGGS
jgi:hypothetical protein